MSKYWIFFGAVVDWVLAKLEAAWKAIKRMFGK